MSVFTAKEDSIKLDPHTRVNYVEGMVLTAEEFKQDQLYALEGDRLHNRILHGYGTVCGLNVSYDPTKGEIVVDGGTGY